MSHCHPECPRFGCTRSVTVEQNHYKLGAIVTETVERGLRDLHLDVSQPKIVALALELRRAFIEFLERKKS